MGKESDKNTTIQTSCKLINFLKEIGKKGESYEKLIIRLAKEAGYAGMLKKFKLIEES